MSEQIEGRVVSIGENGNLVTDIMADQLERAPRDDQVAISCGGHETFGIFSTDHSEPEFTLLAMITQSGHLEIGMVGTNVSEMLGLKAGERVIVRW